MKETKPTPKLIAMVPGFAIGLLWLAIALYNIWTSLQGYANDRSGWGLGWGLVGWLLLGAALSALIGTWWHNFRVAKDH